MAVVEYVIIYTLVFQKHQKGFCNLNSEGGGFDLLKVKFRLF